MADKQGTCRDFERGVCNRGQKCRFFHPEGVEPTNQKLPICKDFQNKGCDRNKCKFLHITGDEEAEYMRTGILPSHGGRPSVDPPRGKGGNDNVCKDFLNNICQRGSRCKFRHITESEYQLEQQMSGGGGGGGMYGKRRRDDFGAPTLMGAFDEENEMLRRKITDLQRQVLDLRQMNDTLYDQNTRYRNQLRGQTASADPYAKPVSYPSALSTSDAPRRVYDGYTQF